jgi:uncharacterized membrane protein (DUF373 family)
MTDDVDNSAAAMVRRRGLGVMESLEDLLYAIIAIFLLGGGGLLLVGAGYYAITHFNINDLTGLVVQVLDKALLVFMIAELIHTIRITLRDRTLAAEDFLIVGLIAGIRRILIVTASGETINKTGPAFNSFAIELGLLITLVLVMVVAIFLFRRAYPGGEPQN